MSPLDDDRIRVIYAQTGEDRQTALGAWTRVPSS